MKIISKTINKIVLEISVKELNEVGFDKMWDRIRRIYPAEDYQTKNIKTDEKTGVITIILEKKTVFSEIG